MKNNSKSNFLSDVREQLRYWPYTLHQLEDTLDISLIEGKAKQILFQSLNAQTLCGFAGSGLSAAYGRLSWSEWKNEQLSVVESNAEAFIALTKVSIEWISLLISVVNPKAAPEADSTDQDQWAKLIYEQMAPPELVADKHEKQRNRLNVWRWLGSRLRAVEHAENEIGQLFATFKRANSSEGNFPGGEALPIQFEIAQQLHDQIRRHLSLFSLVDPEELASSPKDFACEPLNKLFWSGSRQDFETAAPLQALAALKTSIRLANDQFFNGVPCQIEKNYRKVWLQFNKVSSLRTSRLSFETLTKLLLVDECGHASILLRNGLKREETSTREDNSDRLTDIDTALGIYDKTKLKRELDGIRQRPERYTVLSPFRWEVMKRLHAEVLDEPAAQAWKPLLEEVKTTLTTYFNEADNRGDKRRFLTPSSRFLISVYLRLFRDPFAVFAATHANGTKKDQGKRDPDIQEQTGLNLFEQLKPTDFTSRRSIIADRFDPLAKIIRDLGVNRFITTNYDFEIERFFQDSGYRTFDSDLGRTATKKGISEADRPDDYRHDPLGNVLLDRTFKRERASDLLAFAINRGREKAAVFHLHGRATAEDDLVISERDYMNLYLADDEHRDSVDEAIKVAFSSNPILFLGLGMTEADLLRPLRQFISNRDRTVGYNSIALLPAEKSYDERVKTCAALYLRYGVHTIFYGSGQIKVKVKEETRDCGIDWLFRILNLRWALSSQVDSWLKDLKNAKTIPDPLETGWEVKLLKAIDKAVGVLGEDLALGDDISKETPALNVLMGLADKEVDYDKLLENLKNSADPIFKMPFFTPVRPPFDAAKGKTSSSGRAHNRHYDETVIVSGEEYVGFYLKLLEQALRMMVKQSPYTVRSVASSGKANTPAKGKHRNLEAIKDDLETRKILLNGLFGAFVGSSLNAALDGLNREWHLWWKNWQESPPHRSAVFENMDDLTSHSGAPSTTLRETFLMPVRRIRHRVDNSITDMTLAENAVCGGALRLNTIFKLDEGLKTHIRAFDTFIAAVAAQWLPQQHNENAKLAPTNTENPKRRFYTVAALRGQGKGTFMNALCSRLGFSLYARAAWPENGILGPDGENLANREWTEPSIVFPTAIFINYSFSSEIASTYDMIIDAIVDATSRIQSLAQVWMSIDGLYRQQICRAILEDIAPKTNDLLLLGIWKNARQRANSMAAASKRTFAGLSRQQQLAEALCGFNDASDHFLEKKRYKNVFTQPRLFLCMNGVDLLYQDDGSFKNAEIARLVEFLTGDQTSEIPIDLVFVGSERGLGVPWAKPRKPKKTKTKTLAGPLSEASKRESTKQLRLVRIDQVKLAPKAREHVEHRVAAGRLKVSQTAQGGKRDGFVHFARPVSPMEMMISNFPTLAKAFYLMHPPKDGKKLSDMDWEDLKPLLTTARQKEHQAMIDVWSEFDVPNPSCIDLARQEARADLDEFLDKHVKELGECAGLGEKQDDPVKGYLRARYRMPGNPDNQQWHNVRQYLSGNRFCLTVMLAAAQHIVEHAADLKLGAKEAEDFITQTVDRVRNVGEHRKEDLVLSSALDCYRRYQVIGDPQADMDLHMLLLRHLAVIGTPVSTAVLVRLPEFREYFANLKQEQEVSRRRIVVYALSVLCQRGLVFRLSPHPSLVQAKLAPKRDWPADLDFRYALHRVVQRHGMSLLGQGRTDPVRNNKFSPTLYASMASGGPRLSRESYEFLRRLMVGLSQYPDMSQQEAGLEPWLFTTKETEVPIQALRAALSLARASFSVATISRFADYRRLIPGSERRGYLETYKVRLRWIIRKAWELGQAWENNGGKTNGEDALKFNALYRDEVVWLYNELGVTSLAQGSLSDALALFRQAAEFNVEIEGRDLSGPISNLINLNHSIVQLERGRLLSSRNRLKTVKKATQFLPGTVHHAAEGYLCVLDHLTGRTQDLARRFEHVTDFFQETGDKRAASIFLHHRARFLREVSPEVALQLLATARRLAETGGHEDIRHHVQIGEVLVHRSIRGPGKLAESSVFEQVRGIEKFANQMGIASLQCDSMMVQARLLIEQGETSNAGMLLGRSLAISQRFSMNLRSNRALTLYAELLLLRGNEIGAENIAVASLELAKIIGFSLETVRAQKVLSRIGST